MEQSGRVIIFDSEKEAKEWLVIISEVLENQKNESLVMRAEKFERELREGDR